MGGKASTPAAPNYAALQTQQGQQNTALANQNTVANRPNVTTPTGSTTWTQTPGAGFNVDDFYKANPDYAANLATGTPEADGQKLDRNGYALWALKNNPTLKINSQGQTASQAGIDPTTGQGTATWNETQQLSPTQQGLFNQSQANQGTALNLQAQAQGVQGQQLNVQGEQTATAQEALDKARQSLTSNPNFASELSPVTGVSGPTAGNVSYDATSRDRAEQALYNRSTQYIDPQVQQKDAAVRTQLLASGLNENSEAFKTAMSNQQLSDQKLYSDARDSAIAAGGTEATQELGRGLAAEQNQFGESKDISDFNQSEQTRQQNATLQNIGVQSNDRQQSLKDFLSLISSGGNAGSLTGAGSGYTPPVLPGSVGSADQIAGTDITQAGQNQYNAALQAANAQNASTAQNTQAGVSAAASIAGIAAAAGF